MAISDTDRLLVSGNYTRAGNIGEIEREGERERERERERDRERETERERERETLHQVQ